MSAGEERVDVIDEHDRVLETVPRREIRRRNLLHRVTSTFVFHPDGRLFLQKRTDSKDVYPGLYDMCVGGTVTHGETYALNACRELGEELGARGAVLYHLFTHRFHDETTNNLIHVFACIHEGPFTLQAEEVAEGRWATPDEVQALVDTGKVCPDSAQGWHIYRRHAGDGADFFSRLREGAEPAMRCGD